MKTKPSLVRSIGALLGLLVLAALPTALGDLCNPAHDPTCELYYGNPVTVELETDCPVAATIFYTITFNVANNTDPCHFGSTPCSDGVTHAVPNGTHVPIGSSGSTHIRMVAWKLGMYDSNVVVCDQTP
ncbi:MAG TPA: hypothetical protein VJU77_07990 [Chthoniobacterales bacterium]|nr:hypothetical protein [Chthoniobacterales bacterium]